MKKMAGIIFLIVMIMGICSIGAFAESDSSISAGITGFEKASGFEEKIDVQYYLESDDDFENPITTVKSDIVINEETFEDADIYCGARKLKITYTPGTESEIGDQYLVLVRTSNSSVVTESDIVYVDRIENQGEGSIIFNVYPSELISGTTYYIYLRTDGSDENLTEFVPTASFKYYVPYRLGNVDGIDGISANDALFVLQAVAHQRILGALDSLAADVDGIGGISSNDALYILQAVAQQREL